MIGRCTWCAALPRTGRKPPPPDGFCSEICEAYYRAACADLGAELHRAGAVSIDNLRDRLSRIARAGPPPMGRHGVNPVPLVAMAIIIAAMVGLKNWLAG